MSTLIPTITITEFRKLKARQLKELMSCEVYSDGSYLFTFVNAQTDFIKTKVEYLAQRGNALSGRSLEEVLQEADLATV